MGSLAAQVRHGGVGHTWEFDPHIFAKRSRLNEALVSDNRAVLEKLRQLWGQANAYLNP